MKIRFFKWLHDKFKGRKKSESTDDTPHFTHSGLQNNINMPTTGDEAMKRLLACKGKDPYSILGVAPTCTDDDIKRLVRFLKEIGVKVSSSSNFCFKAVYKLVM